MHLVNNQGVEIAIHVLLVLHGGLINHLAARNVPRLGGLREKEHLILAELSDHVFPHEGAGLRHSDFPSPVQEELRQKGRVRKQGRHRRLLFNPGGDSNLGIKSAVKERTASECLGSFWSRPPASLVPHK